MGVVDPNLKIDSSEVQLVGFEVDNEYYGVDILLVQEIIKEEYEITKIPNVPDYVMGIINLRGMVIPIIDLKKRFKGDMASEGAEKREEEKNMAEESAKSEEEKKEEEQQKGEGDEKVEKLKRKKKRKMRKIIIVSKDNKRAGILVDNVTQVIRIPRGYIEPPPPIISGVSSKFFEGVARVDDKVIIIIDIDTIMLPEKEEAKL